jgi:hypothetical protein
MAKHVVLNVFYASDKWRNLRLQLIAERGLICEYCHERVVHANELTLHHIIELTPQNVKDATISLNPNNLLLVHNKCHNRIHKHAAVVIERKVVIVYGPPLSGKNTYVYKHKAPEDLILDYDLLFMAMTGQQLYNKPKELFPNVMAVHNMLIDHIKTRYGRWQTAWVIGGYADHYKRDKMQSDLGAELVFMDVSKQECLARLENDSQRKQHEAEWTKYINKWFEMYTE